MSAWKLLIRNLYNCGCGPAPTAAFDDDSLTRAAVNHGLETAQSLGLLEMVSRGGLRNAATWQLTQAGIDWAEGRAEIVRHSDHRPYIHATWLKALPRAGEIRL